jgi:hypothetical protein
VHNGSETSFTLHDDVGNAHLAAQGGKEDDELDGVDVVRDGDERGFLCFDEGDDVVESVFDEEGFLGVLLITMLEVKQRMTERINGPWHPFPFPRQQTQQQQSNGPSSLASTRGGTCSTA